MRAALHRTDAGRLVKPAAVVLLLAMAILLPYQLTTYQVYLVGVVLVSAIAATGLNLVMGYAGLASVGNAAFLGIGAFTAVFVSSRMHLPLPLLVVLGGLSAAFFSVLSAIPALRLRGLYLAMPTLALQFIAQYVFLRVQEVQHAFSGFTIPTPDLDLTQWYFILLGVLVVSLLVVRNVVRSKFGRGFIALRESEPAAEGCGIDVRGYKLFAFLLSGFIIGVAGVLSGAFQGSVDSATYSLDLTIQYIAMIIIGGMGYLGGGVVGAMVVVLAPQVLSRMLPGNSVNVAFIQDAAYGVLLVAFLIVKPGGLSAVAEDAVAYTARLGRFISARRGS